MFQTGYYTIGQFKGAPIRIHWSTPIGAFVFGGFGFRPGAWVGFVMLILIHELGHAVVVKSFNHQVLGIDITGLHGLCKWTGSFSQIERATVAWGGVWAELLLFVATALLAFIWTPTNLFTHDLVYMFTRVNLFMIVLNLVPVRPLDGAEAWPLFGLLWQRHKEMKALKKNLNWRPPHPADDTTPYDAKPVQPEEPKFSDRVRDKDQSEEYFQRLMQANPVVEEEDPSER